MTNIKLYPDSVDKINQGHRLIQEHDLIHPNQIDTIDEGEIVQFRDESNQFVGKGIVVKQNKGFAWVFTLSMNVFLDNEFLEHIISQAIERRNNLFSDEATNSFRLFNGEGDGLGGFTIDWYAGFLQINWYSKALFNECENIISILKSQLPELRGIYETKRYAISEDDWAIKHTVGEKAPEPLIILENNIQYAVYLGADWMTGIFLDQRHVRQFIQTQSESLTVLNLFSYTGAFSVAAATGGASHTVSVDVANRSLDWTKENFTLNGISTDISDHEIRVMDVFDYISYAKRHQKQFDLVICDPPSFARTKKYQFSVEKDYLSLVIDLFKMTNIGGMTIISTNHSGLDRDTFREEIIEASKQVSDSIYLIQQFELPNEDFPTTNDKESQYLKVFVFYRGA